MKKDKKSWAIKIMRIAVRKLIEAGFSEEEIKEIAGCSIINELLVGKTAEERVDFLLNSDFFWDEFSRNTSPDELSAESILKRNGAYTKEKAQKLDEQLKNIKYSHRYNDFFDKQFF